MQRHVKTVHGKPAKVNGEEDDAALDEVMEVPHISHPFHCEEFAHCLFCFSSQNHPEEIAEEAADPESPSDEWELRLEEDSDEDENNNVPPAPEQVCHDP